MVNIEIKETHFCRSDLRIATKLTDSRESEFPPTTQNVLLILKFTINQIIGLGRMRVWYSALVGKPNLYK